MQHPNHDVGTRMVSVENKLVDWIEYMRDALECYDKEAPRKIIHPFVVKVVIKEEAGTCSKTFPLPDDLYMPSDGNVDLKGFEPMTSTVRL